ncbi:PEP-CTERM sorting domain-containing protein [Nostoc sp. LEGE 06077]|uniref:choice-of-anchor E domain-containing protein n=1 Tax=Nostoc sp. LEGE 06077 TaxID=915325 RepID=UPI00187FF7DE|nr:PEP-CTERM sorting domain-containing protein [Nostoc sp. LEGE 06077]MBE9206770.1 PEP-CTERM sorting domain-containing protein [Nostoc sp. LEGE 06077]
MTTKLFQTLAAATTLAGIVATAGAANAASLSYSSQYQYKPTDEAASADGYYITDIKDTISVQKFNSALGTLKSVTIEFIGNLKGDAGFENRSNNAATVLVNLAGTLNLQLPEGVDRFELNPEQSYSYTVARRDGVLDYAGTSGRTVAGLSAGITETKTFADSSFLQYFLGQGTTDFTFLATANSSISGPGNLASYVTTLASANVNVTYNYDPKAVPEPSAAIGLGLVAGIGLMSQRRKSWLKASN